MKSLIAINDKDLEMVSGGFLKQTESGISAVCDNCECVGAVPLIASQLQPSHMCIECMGKLKETLGDELMKSYLNGVSN